MPPYINTEQQVVEKMIKKTERSALGAQMTMIAEVDRVSVLGRDKDHQFR